MATGRSNKVVGQTGEYLVAAELSRRGLIATTFTGNVPHYDIIASDEFGRHVSIQVKTSRNPSWQFADVTKYFKISFRGKRQILGQIKKEPVRRLVVVFVVIQKTEPDRYFILPWRKLQRILFFLHKAYLKRLKGVRPKKWDSFHAAIKEADIISYEGNWRCVNQALR
jgi:Holliday junction resolvase-like predicted endonuclease